MELITVCLITFSYPNPLDKKKKKKYTHNTVVEASDQNQGDQNQGPKNLAEIDISGVLNNFKISREIAEKYHRNFVTQLPQSKFGELVGIKENPDFKPENLLLFHYIMIAYNTARVLRQGAKPELPIDDYMALYTILVTLGLYSTEKAREFPKDPSGEYLQLYQLTGINFNYLNAIARALADDPLVQTMMIKMNTEEVKAIIGEDMYNFRPPRGFESTNFYVPLFEGLPEEFRPSILSRLKALVKRFLNNLTTAANTDRLPPYFYENLFTRLGRKSLFTRLLEAVQRQQNNPNNKGKDVDQVKTQAENQPNSTNFPEEK